MTRLVRLPAALPFFFTGLRQASSLAVIAAVVAEYFGGLQNGLGSRITSAAANTAYPRAWAFVVGACVLGLVFYLAALLLERLVMPWRRVYETHRRTIVKTYENRPCHRLALSTAGARRVRHRRTSVVADAATRRRPRA